MLKSIIAFVSWCIMLYLIEHSRTNSLNCFRPTLRDFVDFAPMSGTPFDLHALMEVLVQNDFLHNVKMVFYRSLQVPNPPRGIGKSVDFH